MGAIEVEDVNKDTYPDIKVFPLDGCPGIYYQFMNTAVEIKRDYLETTVDTNEAVADLLEGFSTTQEDFFSSTMAKLQAYSENGDMSLMP